MVENPKITIWILNSNWLERLKKVLPSILNQNYENKEILIVDNWSNDWSIEFLKTFTQIKIIENWKNLWYWAWKNILVKNSSWEYILMLDNDIKLPDNDFLNRISLKYKKLNSVFFISPMLVDIDNLSKTTHYWLFNSSIKKAKSIKDLKNLNYILAWWFIWWAVFFEKNKFIELWMYDEIYPFNIDDYDMSCRVYLNWWKCYIDTENYCYHYWIESNKNKKTISFKYKYALCWFLRIILKNYSFKNVIIWLPFSLIWITIKSIKFSIKNKTFWPFMENIKSIFRFLKDLPDTLKQRNIIQKNRIIKENLFLKIKPPKID